ncbi:Uu.00g089690.m01.CDS01 [Anthostomella pinea]|uniref:Uu.00g089690.m01.CDS01 n=1 Tax=Anthostomella pinea TaxID=933095 RepID=A0AAI8VMU9_9PEZI|nr:Uu.00g089690.m01.CDS01 [Anthostomella pinea]
MKHFTTTILGALLLGTASTNPGRAAAGRQKQHHGGNWTCADLHIKDDKHTLAYNCTGGRAHIAGQLDLNACLGTTPGYFGGAQLRATAKDGKVVGGAYVDHGPHSSRNAMLHCNNCDSAEGLRQSSTGGYLDVQKFLNFTRNGIRCLGGAKKVARDELAEQEVFHLVGAGNDSRGMHVDTEARDEDGLFVTSDNIEDKKEEKRAAQDTNALCAAMKANPTQRYQKALGAASCYDIHLESINLRNLTAACPAGVQSDGVTKMQIVSTLDLNHCLMNQNRQMRPEADGSFAGSCNTCQLQKKDTDDKGAVTKESVLLMCNCHADNMMGAPYVELSDVGVLQVVGGQLMCQGQQGYIKSYSKA